MRKSKATRETSISQSSQLFQKRTKKKKRIGYIKPQKREKKETKLAGPMLHTPIFKMSPFFECFCETQRKDPLNKDKKEEKKNHH
jgi:hypothetical protein